MCCHRGVSSGGEGHHCDLVVVGGGIVGLATAREVAIRYPDMKITVVEKENDVGKFLPPISTFLL